MTYRWPTIACTPVTHHWANTSRSPFRDSLRRIVPLREEQTRAFQLALPDREAVFQIAMVVLIRFGMHDHGEIDPGLLHALEQVLGSSRVRRVRRIFVIREIRVSLTGKAVEMGID